MSVLLGALGGLVVGSVGVWWLYRPHFQYLRDELTTAQDRLYGAWQDKAVIPSREDVQPSQPTAEVPLPEWAYAAILDFESVQGKQRAEKFIRERIASGSTKEKILADLIG